VSLREPASPLSCRLDLSHRLLASINKHAFDRPTPREESLDSDGKQRWLGLSDLHSVMSDNRLMPVFGPLSE
jgi:hypothetical protein